ncbi:FHA domain-containing protein [Ramlibacter sp. AW1]|uniref:FHA domain-containing protein n=1 Tax=Ramlibacter aurantiacus TaxID=2801330 RepID=A0A936ZPT0_9BURK|nr:FHA domain-containing protein [Ramlibacter aurantiacus]MBL0421218.1 FHA domain-containing protein [Ramlibacter aurantiacus]
MPKMIISIDGVVIKEVQLTKERTTLGRRPYNDIVIDNLAVSGEHAIVQMVDGAVFVEDLNSTNGTYINGKAVKRQMLQHNDTVEVGKYKIKFISEAAAAQQERAGSAQSVGSAEPAGVEEALGGPEGRALIRVVSGSAAGREVPLVKLVTTIGKPGVAVAAITRRAQGYAISHVDGEARPRLNGDPIGADPVALKDGDVFDLAGTQMQFVRV